MNLGGMVRPHEVAWLAALAVGFAYSARSVADSVTELVTSAQGDPALLTAASRRLSEAELVEPARQRRALFLLGHAVHMVTRHGHADADLGTDAGEAADGAPTTRA